MWDNLYSVKCLKCESAFNQEKALVETFSVIVKTDGCFAALLKILRELSAKRDTDPLELARAAAFEKSATEISSLV